MADNGDAEVDEMLRRIRSLPEALRAAAPEAAEKTKEWLDEQVAAGRAPDGSSWKPKKDGGQALRGAAKAISVVAAGWKIIAKLKGVEVFHNHGAKGGKLPRRQILPKYMIPRSLAQSIRAVLVQRFRRHMGG